MQPIRTTKNILYFESNTMSKSQPHSLPTKPSSKSNTENESTICEKLIPDDLSLERTQYLIAKSLRIIKNKKEQNQRYQQNKKLKESDSVVEPCHNSTKRSTRSEKESIPLFDPVTAIGTEIHRILDYDSVDRMIEAKKSFRWVSHYNKPLFVLQYRTQDRLYFDWLHVKKQLYLDQVWVYLQYVTCIRTQCSAFILGELLKKMITREITLFK